MKPDPRVVVAESASASATTGASTRRPTAAQAPLRRPTLAGRHVRTTVLFEVRTKLVVDGQVETWLYRRERAARAHAARLRAQGWPVAVARAAVVGWSVVE